MRPQTLLRFAALASRFERPIRGVLRAVIEPRKPRHRVLRVVLGLAGLVLLSMLVVVGAVVGAAMIAGGLAWRLLRRPVRPAAEARVFDGAYRVVERPMLTR
jgi:hypothetical protein